MTQPLTTLHIHFLPAEISAFERRYLDHVNRIALVFFALHIPVFTFVAWVNHTGPLFAFIVTTLVVAGPAVARSTAENPRFVSVIHGITAMFMGGLLVHFGQGPMQIEMHFYFFSLLAMCAVFGNPMVIVAAAVTVALHHLVVWLVLPRSVFNYDASVWVVAVHAGFVVLESGAACFIARSFFDNVIGLEKIVLARTTALDAKNRDMRLLLDNVQQGFLTIDNAGSLAPERSAAIDAWFGAPEEGASWFDYLARTSPEFSERSRMGWDEVAAAIMPAELTLDQMPRRLHSDGKIFQVDYRPIGDEPFARYLVVVTDVTHDVAHEHAEEERVEAMAVFEAVLVDRVSFEMFFDEASSIVESLVTDLQADLSTTKRRLHTLKGNVAIFGLPSVADLCHSLEELVVRKGELPPLSAYLPLHERWCRLAIDATRLLGTTSGSIQVADVQLNAILAAITAGASQLTLSSQVQALKLEPTKKRFLHFAEQAQRIATRVEKDGLQVRVVDNGVRLDPKHWATFWTGLIHPIRNAVAHGIELPEERVAAGKSPAGVIELRTWETESQVAFEIEDDGAGIDWDAVRARAVAAGLTVATESDLHQALFADGVSTASSVTDLAGRGIGMGALLDATRALGGELIVESVRGKGTRVRMVFPADVTVDARPSWRAA